jgi:hypothetical protein
MEGSGLVAGMRRMISLEQADLFMDVGGDGTMIQRQFTIGGIEKPYRMTNDTGAALSCQLTGNGQIPLEISAVGHHVGDCKIPAKNHD